MTHITHTLSTPALLWPATDPGEPQDAEPGAVVLDAADRFLRRQDVLVTP